MGNRYTELLFTDRIRALQVAAGSRAGYAAREGGEPRNDRLGPAEAAFIAARDSFYLASVGETGWPYVQHRGGPVGFLRVLDATTLGLADLRGNRQYISLGHIAAEPRVSLFLIDYVQRRRLKLIGYAAATEDPDVLRDLVVEGAGVAERGWVIRVAGFDWNCPQHITQRFTESQVRAAAAPLHARIAALEAELAGLKVQSAG